MEVLHALTCLRPWQLANSSQIRLARLIVRLGERKVVRRNTRKRFTHTVRSKFLGRAWPLITGYLEANETRAPYTRTCVFLNQFFPEVPRSQTPHSPVFAVLYIPQAMTGRPSTHNFTAWLSSGFISCSTKLKLSQLPVSSACLQLANFLTTFHHSISGEKVSNCLHWSPNSTLNWLSVTD